MEKSGSIRLRDLTEEIDRELEMAIMRLLASRGPGGTVSLREAALAVGGESWSLLIEPARAVARRLMDHGVVEMLQPRFQADVRDPATARLKLTEDRQQGFPFSLLN